MSPRVIVDIDGRRMIELRFAGCCLRAFWRGFRRPWLYAWHDWNIYGFGAFGVGFNFWTPSTEAGE